MAATSGYAAARFEVMGTTAEVVVVGGASDALVADAVALLHELEARWSRFRSTSEIAALNLHAGDWVLVSAPTFALVRLATVGWRSTGGRFDPTVLGDLIRAGYDRTFVDITPASAAHARSDLRLGCAAIDLDDVWCRVRLPLGVGFDPGGIAKGLAADMVAESVRDAGADGACVNIGGDVRVTGAAPGSHAWTVELDSDAASDTEDANARPSVLLLEGAVATSGTTARSWTRVGAEQHHVVDPATGRPARGAVCRATVVAPLGWQAEVLTKALLLAAPCDGLEMASAHGAAARIVTVDNETLATPGWPADTRAVASQQSG